MLLAFVRHETLLRRPNEDGSPRRPALVASAKRGNADAIAQLTPPPFPDALEYLYDWFSELRSAGSDGMNGPAAITHVDIDAWARLTDEPIQPHEVHAITTLDRTYRAALRPDDQQPVEEPTAPLPTRAWPPKAGA